MMSNWTWFDEQTLELIELYRSYSVLWDPKHLNHKNRNYRFDAIMEISKVMGVDKSEVERKIKNLTCHYFRERRRTENAKKAGAVAGNSKWFAFNALDFLRDKYKPGNTSDTAQSEGSEDMTVAIGGNRIGDSDSRDLERRRIRYRKPDVRAATLQRQRERYANNVADREHRLKRWRERYSDPEYREQVLQRRRDAYKKRVEKLQQSLTYNSDSQIENVISDELTNMSGSYDNNSQIPPKEERHSDDDHDDCEELEASKHEEENESIMDEPEGMATEEVGAENMYRPHKRKLVDPRVEEAYKIMKAAVANSCSENDDFSVFGEYMANRVRNLNDEYLQCLAKQEISNAIFKIEMMKFRNNNSDYHPTPSTSH